MPEATATHMKMSMNGIEHDMLMPGMLSEEQLAQLDKARGPEFDRLFLTFMIKHHEGALTMVEQLLASYGAAQDDVIFKFSSDIVADQSTEIDRMQQDARRLAFGWPQTAVMPHGSLRARQSENGIPLMRLGSLVRRLGTRRIALPLFSITRHRAAAHDRVRLVFDDDVQACVRGNLTRGGGNARGACDAGPADCAADS